MPSKLSRIMEARGLCVKICSDLDKPPHNLMNFRPEDRELAVEGWRRHHDSIKANLLHVLEHGEYAEGGEEGLCIDAPNAYRGLIVVLLYLAGSPLELYREELVDAWTHDHREVIAAATNRQRLRAMFKQAQYPLPEEWTETVQIWRGTSSLSQEKAARGIAWTTDRDTACWFAMRFAQKNGKPLVQVAHVPKSSILFYDEGRGEYEAICFDVGSPIIDGDREDWLQGYKRTEHKRSVACKIGGRLPDSSLPAGSSVTPPQGQRLR